MRGFCPPIHCIHAACGPGTGTTGPALEQFVEALLDTTLPRAVQHHAQRAPGTVAVGVVPADATPDAPMSIAAPPMASTPLPE